MDEKKNKKKNGRNQEGIKLRLCAPVFLVIIITMVLRQSASRYRCGRTNWFDLVIFASLTTSMWPQSTAVVGWVSVSDDLIPQSGVLHSLLCHVTTRTLLIVAASGKVPVLH